MARQLGRRALSLGQALAGHSVAAWTPVASCRAAQALATGAWSHAAAGLRGFSAAGAEEPPRAAAAGATPGADLRETVERRLSADASAARRSSSEQAEPAAAKPAAAPRRERVVVKRAAQEPAATGAASGGAANAPAAASASATRTADALAAPAAPDEPPRLHPLRLFYPGQTYKPEDLDVQAADPSTFVHRAAHKTRQLHKRGQAANAELYTSADFRNGRLLSGFISEAGKLLPRRTNKVDAKVQRALVRAVKTARMMAILPFTERLPAFTRVRKNPYV